MYKISIVNWRLAYLPATRPRQQSGRSRSKGWPVCVDGRHHIGETLARAAARGGKDLGRAPSGRTLSVADRLRLRRHRQVAAATTWWNADIARRLEHHQVGKLLTTIRGIGSQTAASIIAELGDPARFGSVKALASYVGVVPRLRQSGKRRLSGPGACFRSATLVCGMRYGCRPYPPFASNRGCAPFICGCGRREKPPKVALIAAMHKLLAAIFSLTRGAANRSLQRLFFPPPPLLRLGARYCRGRLDGK